LAFIVSRASGQSAQILASARSPLESLVPPLLTWLKINYFLSIVLAVLFTSLIGGLIYKFILLRVRGMPISEVIASFGIGLAILEFFRFWDLSALSIPTCFY
jgi:branched-subunit amino acid ABC-type transport system permease component